MSKIINGIKFQTYDNEKHLRFSLYQFGDSNDIVIVEVFSRTISSGGSKDDVTSVRVIDGEYGFTNEDRDQMITCYGYAEDYEIAQTNLKTLEEHRDLYPEYFL